MSCGELCLFSLGPNGLKPDPWPDHRNLTSQAPDTHSGVLPTTPTNVYDASWRNATLGQKLYTLRPRQNGHHFADDILMHVLECKC